MKRVERARILERIDAATMGVPWSHPRVCHLLFDLALSFERPQILEVSCCYGKATAYLATAARLHNGRVRSVDQYRLWWRGRTAADLVNQVGASGWCDITFEQDARWYLLELLTANPGEWIDLAFVDASHSVEVDAFIALAAWTHLRPGGVLVLDDLDWTAKQHAQPDWPFSRPSHPHVRTIYDYIRALPDVDEAIEWGRAQVEWSWGLLRKQGSRTSRGRGVTNLLARLPSVNGGGD